MIISCIIVFALGVAGWLYDTHRNRSVFSKRDHGRVHRDPVRDDSAISGPAKART